MVAWRRRQLSICLVASSYPRFEEDGNARFMRSIAEAQAALGHEVHVLAPYSPQVRPYDSPVHLHWFRYVRPARWGVMGHAAALENDRQLKIAALWQAPLFGLSLALQMQKLFCRQRIDLIHAHWVIPSGTIANWMGLVNRKPLFITLHGSDMYVATRNVFWGTMARGALRNAKGITACSQPLADSAIQLGACPGRVHVVPNGVDPARFKSHTPRDELRRRLDLPRDALIILAAGRLVAKKGFNQLIRAIPAVLAAGPHVRLVILGEGPQRPALERLRAELNVDGMVSLPGAVPWRQVADYLFASDVFVMPSVRDASGNLDGLPTVIPEAMAAGLPVVATRIAGIPLAVQDNVTGLLVDMATPEQLSSALVRLLKSAPERSAMGLAGRTRVESELNWGEFAKCMDQLYGPVLEGL